MKDGSPKKGLVERIKKWDAARDPAKAEQQEEAIRRLQEQRETEARQREYAGRTAFSVWDYVMLESVRRGDPRIRIRIGTMKALASLERLSLAGWIEKPAGKVPFDDMERLEAFRDTNEYRLYKDRLGRILSGEDFGRMRHVLDALHIKNIDDWLVLTEEGRRAAEEKRASMRIAWDRLRRLYVDKSAEFRQAAEGHLESLPLFLVMGFANGAMMAQMMSEAHVDCPYWYGELYVAGSPNAWNELDGFNGGFDGGF